MVQRRKVFDRSAEHYWELYDALNEGIRRDEIAAYMQELHSRVAECKEYQKKLRIQLIERSTYEAIDHRFVSKEAFHLAGCANMIITIIAGSHGGRMNRFHARAVLKYVGSQLQKIYNRVYHLFYELQAVVQRRNGHACLPPGSEQHYLHYLMMYIVRPFMKLAAIVQEARLTRVTIEGEGSGSFLKYVEGKLAHKLIPWLVESFAAIRKQFSKLCIITFNESLDHLCVTVGRNTARDRAVRQLPEDEIIEFFGMEAVLLKSLEVKARGTMFASKKKKKGAKDAQADIVAGQDLELHEAAQWQGVNGFAYSVQGAGGRVYGDPQLAGMYGPATDGMIPTAFRGTHLRAQANHEYKYHIRDGPQHARHPGGFKPEHEGGQRKTGTPDSALTSHASGSLGTPSDADSTGEKETSKDDIFDGVDDTDAAVPFHPSLQLRGADGDVADNESDRLVFEDNSLLENLTISPGSIGARKSALQPVRASMNAGGLIERDEEGQFRDSDRSDVISALQQQQDKGPTDGAGRDANLLGVPGVTAAAEQLGEAARFSTLSMRPSVSVRASAVPTTARASAMVATEAEKKPVTLDEALTRAVEVLDNSIDIEVVEEWLSWDQDPEVMRRKWNADESGFREIRTRQQRRKELLDHVNSMMGRADPGEAPMEAVNALGMTEWAQGKSTATLRKELETAIAKLQEFVENDSGSRKVVSLAEMKKAQDFSVTKIINAEQEKIKDGNRQATNFVLRNTESDNRLLRLEVIFKLFVERLILKPNLMDVLRVAYMDCAADLPRAPGMSAEEHDVVTEYLRLLIASLQLLIGQKVRATGGRTMANRWEMIFKVENFMTRPPEEEGPNASRVHAFNVVFNGEFPSALAGNTDLFSTRENSFVTSPNTASEITFGDLHSATFQQVLSKVAKDGDLSVSRQLLPRLIKGLMYYSMLAKHLKLQGKANAQAEGMMDLCETTASAILSGKTDLKEDHVQALEKALAVSRYIRSEKCSQAECGQYLGISEVKVRGKVEIQRDPSFKYDPATFKDKEINRLFLYRDELVDEFFVPRSKLKWENKVVGNALVISKLLKAAKGAKDRVAAKDGDGKADQGGSSGDGERTDKDHDDDDDDEDGPRRGDGDDEHNELTEEEHIHEEELRREAEDAAAEAASKLPPQPIDAGDEEEDIFVRLMNELVAADLFFRIFVDRGDAVFAFYGEILRPALEAKEVPTGALRMQELWVHYMIEVIYPHMLETYNGVDDPEMHQEYLRELLKMADGAAGRIKSLQAILLPLVTYIMRAVYDTGFTFFPFQVKLFGLYCQGIYRPSTYAKEQVTAGGGKSFVALAIKKFHVQNRHSVLFKNVLGVLYISNMPPEEFGMPFEEFIKALSELERDFPKKDYVSEKRIGNFVGLTADKVKQYMQLFETTQLESLPENADKEHAFLDFCFDRAKKDGIELFAGGVHATFDELDAIASNYGEHVAKLRFGMLVDEADYGPLPDAYGKYPKIGFSATTIWGESISTIQYLYKSEMRLMGGRSHYPKFWGTFRSISKDLSGFRELVLSEAKNSFRKDLAKLVKAFEEYVKTLEHADFEKGVNDVQKAIGSVKAATVRRWSLELQGVCIRHLKEICESTEILDLPDDGSNFIFGKGDRNFQADINHFLGSVFNHPDKELENVNSALLMLPDYETFDTEKSIVDFIQDVLFKANYPMTAGNATVLAQSKFEGKFKILANFKEKKIEKIEGFTEENENDRIEGRIMCLYTVDSRGGDFKLNSNFIRTFLRAAVFETTPGAVTYYQTLRRMRLRKPGMPERKGPPLKTSIYLRERAFDLLRASLVTQLRSEKAEFAAYVRREIGRAEAAIRVASRKVIKVLRSSPKYEKVEGAGYLKKSTKKDPVTNKPEITAFERIFKNYVTEAIDVFISKCSRGEEPSISTFEGLWKDFFKKKSDAQQKWDEVVKKDFNGKFARTESTYIAFYKIVSDEFRASSVMEAKFFDLYYFAVL